MGRSGSRGVRTMKKTDMLAIDGVFLAVKCAVCGTIYPAEEGDYISFFGDVTQGLETKLVGVTPPARPAKRSMVAVCRTPACMGVVVRQLLVGEGAPADDPLWAHALRSWVEEAGHTFVEAGGPEPVKLKPKERLKAKARR